TGTESMERTGTESTERTESEKTERTKTEKTEETDLDSEKRSNGDHKKEERLRFSVSLSKIRFLRHPPSPFSPCAPSPFSPSPSVSVPSTRLCAPASAQGSRLATSRRASQSQAARDTRK